MHAKQEWGRQMAKRAFDKLDAIVKSRGHGAITKLERSLGYEPGWYKNHRKPNHIMGLPNLLAALRELGERPTDFFDGWIEEEQVISRKVPIVLGALAQANALKSKQRSKDGIEEKSCLNIEFEQLDSLRFSDPVEVLRIITSQITAHSSFEALSKALSIAGSCYRSIDRLEAAFESLDAARFLGSHDDALVGDSLQRLTYCYNRVDPNKALRLAREACLIYAKQMNLQKIGETQIDQANSYYALGDWARSQEQLLAGLKYKEFLREVSLAAIYQGLALVTHALGNHEESMEWFSRAEELASTLENLSLLAHVLWAKGRLSREVESLKAAHKVLQQLSPFDATMCLLDICNLEQSRLGQKDCHLIEILRNRCKDRERAFLTRISEDILSELCLGRKVDVERTKKKVNTWRVRDISLTLARLESDSYSAAP